MRDGLWAKVLQLHNLLSVDSHVTTNQRKQLQLVLVSKPQRGRQTFYSQSFQVFYLVTRLYLTGPVDWT